MDMKAPEGIKTYLPLIIIVGFCMLLALVQKEARMYSFMGYFLVILSMFKMFDLKGFAQAFASYDFVSQKFPPYAMAYPFIELFLGLAYVGHFIPMIINILTIVVMGAGAVGVVNSLRSGQSLECACLGTVLKLPLSVVSAVEYLGMIVMAVLMLLSH